MNEPIEERSGEDSDADMDAVESAGSEESSTDEGLTEETETFLDSDDVELEDGQLAYECAAWAGESRGLLESLLVTQEIPHAWQGTTVTVREADEERVDALIDDVLASARPALDPRAPRIVYEVGVWPVALQTELVDQLTAADVPYEWDENGDLVVRESDEAEVETVLALLPDPDPDSLSSDDGMQVHEVLDSVFMTSDRLARHATDASATVGLVEVVARLEQMALPFGFEPPQWRRLVAAGQRVRDAIEPPEDAAGQEDVAEGDVVPGPATDQQISGLAVELRDMVRQYI